MSGWLLSVVGVIFIGVLLDLIYPNGKTNSLCKSIFGIIAVFVIVTPILNINIENFQIDTVGNSELIENINEAKIDTIKRKIINHLSECGIEEVIVKIDSSLSEEQFEVEKIYVDTTNLVLTENITNINKYEVIINEISSLLKIDKERIVVYG